jgi:opacity protein-like surface antigen
MKSHLWLLLLLTLLAVTKADAAVVYLRDGSTLKGTIVSATARDIQLHTQDGELTITSDRISRIDYADGEPLRKDEPPRSSRLVLPAEDRAVGPTNQYFSMALGAAVPMSRVDFGRVGGGTDDNGTTGVLLGVQYLYGVTSKLGVGSNIEFFNRGERSSQNLAPARDTTVSGNTILLLASMKYSFTDRGFARPYVLGGVGTNRTSTLIEASPSPGYGWLDTETTETRAFVDSSRWGFASTVRFGVDFSYAEPSVFSLEMGWTRLSNGAYPATRVASELESVTGNLSALAFAARWGWRF